MLGIGNRLQALWHHLLPRSVQGSFFMAAAALRFTQCLTIKPAYWPRWQLLQLLKNHQTTKKILTGGFCFITLNYKVLL